MSTTEKEKRYQKYHYEAVERRYAGSTYQVITDELNQNYGKKIKKQFKEPTVRKWFMRGGFLEKLYLDYARQENERRRQVVMEELKKVTPIIPEKIHDLLKKRHLYSWGKLVKDEEGKPVELLDSTTVKTLALLADMLGFKIRIDDTMDESDLDKFWDKVDEKIAKDRGEGETPSKEV